MKILEKTAKIIGNSLNNLINLLKVSKLIIKKYLNQTQSNISEIQQLMFGQHRNLQPV